MGPRAGLRFWGREESLTPAEIRTPDCPCLSLFLILTRLFRLNLLLQDSLCFCPVLGVGTKMYRTVRRVILSPEHRRQCSVLPNIVVSFGLPDIASALEG